MRLSARFCVIAASRGTRLSSSISVSCRKMRPVASMVMTRGSSGSCSTSARVCGRSTGMPAVSSGAVTMKTMSRTSITSTIGVTLISLIGW
jgi:hypothetical protein